LTRPGRRHARNAVRSSTHATPTAAARRRRGTEKLALSELELAASELPMVTVHPRMSSRSVSTIGG